MSNMQGQGYSGRNYDRWVERDDNSTIHNIKKSYWTTKQAVIKKFGKKEDEHVVASDSELDTKLEVFKAIQRSCMELLRVIERYQDRLCVLSQEENAMGRYLKSKSAQDKTRAGKMMAAVGKSQSFSAQQRLALRVPLVRLYQEVETFRYRAISDTLMTINRMEGARTEYRGALLWMKDVSEELDPDTYKQLDKFRKVQAQVRKTKAKFDKLKLDVMQKIDLLAASRCNMFSHVLATYQSTLLNFWSRTSRTMTAVAESFKGYQYYEFNMLKELQEPNKKLAEETATPDEAEEQKDVEEDEDNRDSEADEIIREIRATVRDDVQIDKEKRDKKKNIRSHTAKDRLLSLEGEADEALEEDTNFEDAFDKQQQELKGLESQHQSDRTSFIDFGDAETTNLLQEKSSKDNGGSKPGRPQGQIDLLSDPVQLDDEDKDDITLLNEILNAPSTGGDGFTQEWDNVFGTAASSNSNLLSDGTDQTDELADFMPSHLLESRMAGMNLGRPAQQPMMPPGGGMMQQRMMGQGMPPGGNPQQPLLQKQLPTKKDQKADMSAWFNLFADLDPLSNPDAIGRKGSEMPDAM